MTQDMIDVDLKELLVFAIKGKGVTHKVPINEFVDMGLIEFCGNQWNEDFRWVSRKLETMTIEELAAIFKSI